MPDTETSKPTTWGKRVSREELVLAALATSKGGSFQPVQVQKMFFLVDEKIPDMIGGPFFQFKPYDYGPFDRRVYDELERLSEQGLVEIVKAPWYGREYRLTPEGQKRGETILGEIDPRASSYLQQVSDFVRRLSFAELVGSIYKAFPDMKRNSVFREP